MAIKYGYKLSSEEQDAPSLIAQARRAEQVGFDFGAISDHFHPWIDKQGNSEFVWATIGAISQVTSKLEILTGVTCPTIRMHPAIVAQAAATAATLLPDRFTFGVGSGENLNEHILGHRWPPAHERLDMLEEAIEVIRALWTGKNTNFHGEHYDVENARLYSLPDEPPPIAVAASGNRAISIAADNDAVIALAPDADMLKSFDEKGGTGKPKYCEITVCWDHDKQKAAQTVLEWWPVVGAGGELMQELPLPRHFEQATHDLDAEDVMGKVACGPDPEEHLELIRKYANAGYTHVWIHQVGPNQDGFFDFFEKELAPRLP